MSPALCFLKPALCTLCPRLCAFCSRLCVFRPRLCVFCPRCSVLSVPGALCSPSPALRSSLPAAVRSLPGAVTMLTLGLSCVLLHVFVVFGTELTFELPDNDKQCFYEELEKDVKFDIDFQVIAGGNYDVDCFVTDPQDDVLYNEKKKQYDSFSHTTAMKGVYKVCFSNEFSSFTYKTVYLDFRHGDEEPLMPNMNKNSALTQMESSCVSIHEVLKVVADSQTWYRLREAHDRTRAEHLLERVTYWSIGETILLFVIGIGQVVLLKSFFVEKKGSVAAST